MEINGYKVFMVYKNLDRIWANFSIPSRTVTSSWKTGPITLHSSQQRWWLGSSTDYHHSRNYHTFRGWNSMKSVKTSLLSSPIHYYKILCFFAFRFAKYNHLLVTPYKKIDATKTINIKMLKERMPTWFLRETEGGNRLRQNTVEATWKVDILVESSLRNINKGLVQRSQRCIVHLRLNFCILYIHIYKYNFISYIYIGHEVFQTPSRYSYKHPLISSGRGQNR